MMIKTKSYRYFLFYKPFDVLSQFTSDIPGQRNLSEFGLPSGIYAAGRLDRDSEGLLLLTDDGKLIEKLLNPQNGHEREYWVQVEGEIQEEHLRQLEKGVVIGGGYKTRSAQAFFLEKELIPEERNPPIRFRKHIPTSWIRLVLSEGKNRQVRKMTAAVGFPTLRLIRHRILSHSLENLKMGEFKEISFPF